MRYTGPRNKIARREGMDLGLKTPGTNAHAKMLKKLNVKPGQHGARTRRKTSEHGKQLREKQKLRYMFGITEKQLQNYFNSAKKREGNTADMLSMLLESRLDNVMYRAGLAPTRSSARQLVTHKHVNINGKILNIPSYQVKQNDVITYARETDLSIPAVKMAIEKKDTLIPEWVDRKAVAVKLINTPNAELINKQINLRLIIEFYSR